MENTKKLYDICRPSWARATPTKGGWGKLEPADDDSPSAYTVRVSAEYDNCQHGYIDARNEAEIWSECELIELDGRVVLKTRETWHGKEADWSGDYVGRVSEHPILESLCDRAKEAVERYLKGKSAGWWRRIRSSVLRSPGLDAVLSVRLPQRKGYIVLARVELVTPSN